MLQKKTLNVTFKKMLQKKILNVTTKKMLQKKVIMLQKKVKHVTRKNTVVWLIEYILVIFDQQE